MPNDIVGDLVDRPTANQSVGDPYLATDTHQGFIWDGSQWVEANDAIIADCINKRHSHTQQAHVADPTGGVVVDAECRAALVSLLTKLETLGFLASS